jgi:hypothetical protein
MGGGFDATQAGLASNTDTPIPTPSNKTTD